MICIFRRELRENLKWGIVIFAVALVIVIHELRDAETMLMFRLLEFIWLAPMAGLLMGAVQTIFETKPDNWGFAVHRPVPRSSVFIGKSVAGLLLLYTALIVPCLIAAIWAARPGNLPIPFQARMVCPTLADVLNAGCYYFAGIVLTLRRARWFGTRLLPLGLALLSSAATVMFIGPFWVAVLFIVLVQALGALAAWSAFSTNGAADGPVATRFALGAMIYPGAIGVGMGLLGASQAFIPGSRWQYYQVDRSGDLVRITQTIEHGDRRWAITDPQGRPLPKYDNLDLDDAASRDTFVRFNAQLVNSSTLPWPMDVLYTNQGFRFPTPGLVPLRVTGAGRARLRVFAIYNVPRRIIELVDPVTRVQIGTVGPSGFQPPRSNSPALFPGTPHGLFLLGSSRVLAFDSAVYLLELDHRRVRQIYAATADDPIFSAAAMGTTADSLILVATRSRLHVLGPDGQPHFTLAWPVDPATHHFSAAILPANGHLALNATSIPGVAPVENTIFEYSSDGALVRGTISPQLSNPRSPKRIETMMLGAMFPVAGRAILRGWILDNVLDVRTQEFASSFATLMWMAAALSAAVTLLIGRRCGLTWIQTTTWSALNLLLGVAGIVVMLGVIEWPPRERCAKCGRLRLIGSRDCLHCGAPLSPWPRDGWEIFEPADTFLPESELLAAT